MRRAAGHAIWGLRRVLMNKLGIDIVPYRHTRHPIARRMRLFAREGIDLILDVGANSGQYGRFLRNIGYEGRIISFEPLSRAFENLTAAATGDSKWEVRRLALGNRVGKATLNVAGNSESSSLLQMLPAHLKAYPESKYVGSEEVEIATLDRIIGELPESSNLFVKIDTQGYERSVIEGAGATIARVRGVQLEMSLVPLYQGEPLLPEMVMLMAGLGFVMMGVEPGASDPESGQLLQFDGIFFRQPQISASS